MAAVNNIPLAPPPWQLTAEVFMFLGWSWTPSLPPGSFDPREEQALRAADSSVLERTPYGIQIYRYKTSPVGPYDELMFIPGFYRTQLPGKNESILAPRITRIYISTEATALRGRENWNIPKHLADFDFDYKPGKISVKVCPQGSDKPFFAGTFTLSSYLPSFPFSTDWMPFSLSLLQPPLPEISDVIAGTKQWQYTPLRVTMKNATVAYLAPDLDEGKAFADGVGFPNVGPRVGVYTPTAVVDFLVPSQPEVRPRPDTKKKD